MVLKHARTRARAHTHTHTHTHTRTHTHTHTHTWAGACAPSRTLLQTWKQPLSSTLLLPSLSRETFLSVNASLRLNHGQLLQCAELKANELNLSHNHFLIFARKSQIERKSRLNIRYQVMQLYTDTNYLFAFCFGLLSFLCHYCLFVLFLFVRVVVGVFWGFFFLFCFVLFCLFVCCFFGGVLLFVVVVVVLGGGCLFVVVVVVFCWLVGWLSFICLVVWVFLFVCLFVIAVVVLMGSFLFLFCGF